MSLRFLNHLTILIILIVGFTFPAFCGINEWTYVGLDSESITSIAINPSDPNTILIGSLDIWLSETYEGGLFRTTNRGLTWDTIGFRHTSVLDIAFDPLQPQNIWIANGSNNQSDRYGLWYSTNGGETWATRDSGIFVGGIEFVSPQKIAVCPYDPRYLLTATLDDMNSGRLYFTDNGGAQWHVHSNFTLVGQIFRLLYDPSSIGHAYIAAENNFQFYVSTDSGRTLADSINFPWSLTFSDMDVAPHHAGSLWAITFWGAVMRSNDHGQNWHEIVPRCITLDSLIWGMDVCGSGDTIAFAGTDAPYLTLDGGEHLLFLSSGYLSVPIDLIKIVSTDPLEIWAYMRNHGVLSYTYRDTTNSVAPTNVVTTKTVTATVWPNPVANSAWLQLNTVSVSPLTITMINILGQQVRSWVIPSENKEIYLSELSTLPSGQYFLSLTPLQPCQSTTNVRVTIIK